MNKSSFKGNSNRKLKRKIRRAADRKLQFSEEKFLKNLETYRGYENCNYEFSDIYLWKTGNR